MMARYVSLTFSSLASSGRTYTKMAELLPAASASARPWIAGRGPRTGGVLRVRGFRVWAPNLGCC